MEIFKYCPINENTLENLENEQIFFSSVNDVNDPYEGIIDIEVHPELEYDFLKFFYRERLDNELLQQFTFEELKANIIYDSVDTFHLDSGMSCFSELNTSLVMWGLYANKHKGLCIGYDSTIGVFKHAQRITYRNDVIKINIDTPEKISFQFMVNYFEDALYSKHQVWESEKEWRIIASKSFKCKYPDTAIKAIYFGRDTSETDIKRVKEVTKSNRNIQYYKAVLARNKYSIDFIRI